jgi:putative transposase
MRLKPRLRQNAMHARFAHAHLGRQLTHRPVCASVLRLLLPFPAHLGLHPRRSGSWLAALVEEQIIGILKQSEAGAKTSELCRQHGISAATFYGWRSKYGGMDVSEAKRLKKLEEENSNLKGIVLRVLPSLYFPKYPKISTIRWARFVV